MVERLVSDIGGLPAGEIPLEERRQLFWEKQLIATVNLLTKRLDISLDEYRRSAEEMSPDHYMSSGLYDRRLDGWLSLLFERGIIDPDEHRDRTQNILRDGTRDVFP